VTRLLQMSEVKPQLASRGLHRLASTIEAEIRRGLHDWHAMQTLHLASIAESAAGNHAGAAATLARIAEHQKRSLDYELRAYVSASAAAALESAKAGDIERAQAVVQQATPWGRRLQPPDRLLESARRLIRAWRRGHTRLANQRVKPTATGRRVKRRVAGRRGLRAGRWADNNT
jgi:hypothetical protein